VHGREPAESTLARAQKPRSFAVVLGVGATRAGRGAAPPLAAELGRYVEGTSVGGEAALRGADALLDVAGAALGGPLAAADDVLDGCAPAVAAGTRAEADVAVASSRDSGTGAAATPVDPPGPDHRKKPTPASTTSPANRNASHGRRAPSPAAGGGGAGTIDGELVWDATALSALGATADERGADANAGGAWKGLLTRG